MCRVRSGAPGRLERVVEAPPAPLRLVAGQATTTLIHATAIEPWHLAGNAQRQSVRALLNGQTHGVFPLFERSRIDNTFFEYPGNHWRCPGHG